MRWVAVAVVVAVADVARGLEVGRQWRFPVEERKLKGRPTQGGPRGWLAPGRRGGWLGAAVERKTTTRARALAAATCGVLCGVPAAHAGGPPSAVLGPLKVVLRVVLGAALLGAVALSTKAKVAQKAQLQRRQAKDFERFVGSPPPSSLVDDLAEAAPATTTTPVVAAKKKKAEAPAAPKRGGVLGAFRKKAGRAVSLEDLLTKPSDGDLEASALKVREFAVAIAGLVATTSIRDVNKVLRPAFAERLTEPWEDLVDDADDEPAAAPPPPKEEEAAAAATRAPSPAAALAAWQARAEAASHYDAGVRATAVSEAHVPVPATAGAWRAACASGVVSHYDFGLRATTAAAAQAASTVFPTVTADDEVEETVVPLIYSEAQIAVLERMMRDSGLTAAEAAEAFANVANALLVPLVDLAVESYKSNYEDDAVRHLAAVARFATDAGALFDRLGLVEALNKPVVYEGSAKKAVLQTLFAKFAAAAVAAASEDAAAAVARVEDIDVLQAIFQISERQAERLSQQVVTKIVEKMMAEMTAEEQAEAAAAVGGAGGPADAEAQLAQLEDLVNSGQLSGEERREIKKMFAQMMGIPLDNIDATVQQAAQNINQMDPQTRRAFKVIQKLV